MTDQKFSNLDLVKSCDNFPYEDFNEPLYKLYLPGDDRPHGYMLESNVKLMPWTDKFQVDHSSRTVSLKDTTHGKDLSAACNQAFKELIDDAIEKDVFRTLHFQHSEPFPILGAKYPVNVERFAGDLFGITARGAHMTMYTRTHQSMKIWVPRRNANMFTYPNKLDTTVAGGVAATETPFQNIIREAQEEASLPEDLITKNIRATGVLTYISHFEGIPGGKEPYICPDIVYVFDLEVGSNVKPVPEDGEVKEFYLVDVKEVQEALSRGEFKTNSAIVMLDFFVRHGIVTSDNEKDYVEIVQRMHRRLPFPTAP